MNIRTRLLDFGKKTITVEELADIFKVSISDTRTLSEKITELVNEEWSDEWLYNQIFTTKCKEKEDELPERSTHDLLMKLVEIYWEERVKKIYYWKVKPKIEEI